MILLPVDEAFAFDYLAVLRVKADNGLKVEQDIRKVASFLRVQTGDKFNQVIESEEFLRSYVANRQVFRAIELAHQGRIAAYKVQEINYKRYVAKQQLQARFWPESTLTEVKTKP